MSQEQQLNKPKKKEIRGKLLAATCATLVLIMFMCFNRLSQHQYDLFFWLATLCLLLMFPGGLIAYILIIARRSQRHE